MFCHHFYEVWVDGFFGHDFVRLMLRFDPVIWMAVSPTWSVILFFTAMISGIRVGFRAVLFLVLATARLDFVSQVGPVSSSIALTILV